jgi:hypothetical protein
MTSTSFQSPSSGCRGAPCDRAEMTRPVAERDETLNAPLAPSYAHAAETRRMKAFTGQCKFQAPVADDFFRGLSDPERPCGGGSKASRHAGWIPGLVAWLRG